MAYLELKYFSKALQKASAATIILPEGEFKGPFPTLYLLHGLSDDNTMWQRRTSIERYVQNLPLIVVMPDGGRSFYTNAVDGGPAYETAIVGDLVQYIDKMFHTDTRREARCTAGLSMGGYGAIKLALRFPDLFCAACSHSGALGYSHWPLKPDDIWGKEMIRIVGEKSTGGVADLYALSSKLAKKNRPALYIDCGVDDFLIGDNRSFTEHLNTLGYDHIYQEYPGAHNWEYWDLHIQQSIEFVMSEIGKKK